MPGVDNHLDVSIVRVANELFELYNLCASVPEKSHTACQVGLMLMAFLMSGYRCNRTFSNYITYHQMNGSPEVDGHLHVYMFSCVGCVCFVAFALCDLSR